MNYFRFISIFSISFFLVLTSCKKDTAPFNRLDPSALKLSKDLDLDLRPDFLELANRQNISDLPKWSYKYRNFKLKNTKTGGIKNLKLWDTKVVVKHEILQLWNKFGLSGLAEQTDGNHQLQLGKNTSSFIDELKSILLHQQSIYFRPTDDAISLIEGQTANDVFEISGDIEIIPENIPSYLKSEGSRNVAFLKQFNYQDLKNIFIDIRPVSFDWPVDLNLKSDDLLESQPWSFIFQTSVSKLDPLIILKEDTFKIELLAPGTSVEDLAAYNYIESQDIAWDMKEGNDSPKRAYFVVTEGDESIHAARPTKFLNLPGQSADIYFKFPPLKTTLTISGVHHTFNKFPLGPEDVRFTCGISATLYWFNKTTEYNYFRNDHNFNDWWYFNGIVYKDLPPNNFFVYREKNSAGNAQFQSITFYTADEEIKNIRYRPNYFYHSNALYRSRCGATYTGLPIPPMAAEFDEEVIGVNSF
jgi:hypothetical protein